ncbi:MAG TPA: glycosyltransferase, partial [Thermoplasmata archaeon]|nr:glycosyltransferase [Thermoplasmata archaeon]
MALRSIDLIATGPPSPDPYHPTAPAWALAGSLGARGHRVRVLHPELGEAVAPPPGVVAVPLPFPFRRPGAALEGADWARAAALHFLPDTDLVIRDPSGLGSLGLGRGPRRETALAAFVRGIELSRFDRAHAGRSVGGMVGRVDAWRERRSIRRLERAALAEADRLFVDHPTVRETLVREYGLDEDRLSSSVSPVALSPSGVERARARQDLGIPLDVPVVAALAASGDPSFAGVDRVREAFRRIRPIFPGVRLIVAGATCPTDPGTVADPAREGATFDRALAASDVALFAPRVPGFDPGVVLAQRAGVASIVLPEVELPLDPSGTLRRV